MSQRVDKAALACNKPRRTPGHPEKSHVVKACYDGKEKVIRFGEQGASTAGKPKQGESEKMTKKRASFKARHAKNIAKGPSSAAYWANKVKWAEGGPVMMASGGGLGVGIDRILRRRYPEAEEFDPVAATLIAQRRAASRQPLPLPPTPPVVAPPPPAGEPTAEAGTPRVFPGETAQDARPRRPVSFNPDNPFVAEATRLARKYNLPEGVFLSLIKQESGYNPTIESPRGAYGLTQLMPATARELGVDPRDPYQNLEGGARYLRQMIDRFGNLPLALAAYNAGPGTVRKAGNVIPDIKETKDYVESVMRNAGITHYAEGGSVRRPAAAPTMTPFDPDYIEQLAARAVGAGEPVTEVRSSEGRGFAPMARSFGEAGQRMSAVLRGDVEPTPEEERQINVVRGFAEGPASIRAYHGSPYRFDRFDISKIGTGEGATAYGHGLYFAESEPVARYYRDTLSDWAPPPIDPAKLKTHRPTDLASLVDSLIAEFPTASAPQIVDIIRDRFLGVLPRDLTQIIREAKEASRPTGSMYEVRLRTTPEELVNWDAPLVRQPERAIPFLEDVLRAPRTGSARVLEREMKPIGEAVDLRTPEVAAQLREAGVPGIRYLDAGSRTGRQNTRNYVMFGDDLIDITRRYAEGGLADLDEKYADGGMVREPATTYDPDEIDRIVQEFAEGGEVEAPAETTIGGQEHKLAYITDREAALLKARGGSGRMTDYGVRAYDADPGGDAQGSDPGPDGPGPSTDTSTDPGPATDSPGPRGGMSNEDPEGTPAAANMNTAVDAAREGRGVGIADTGGVAPTGFNAAPGIAEAIGAYSRGEISLAEALGYAAQTGLAPPGVTPGISVDEFGVHTPAISVDPLGLGLGLMGMAIGVPGLGALGGRIGSAVSQSLGISPSVISGNPNQDPAAQTDTGGEYSRYGQTQYGLPGAAHGGSVELEKMLARYATGGQVTAYNEREVENIVNQLLEDQYV